MKILVNKATKNAIARSVHRSKLEDEARTEQNEIERQIDRAMLEVNALSNIARAAGDLPTMYAANRAWRQLFDARQRS